MALAEMADEGLAHDEQFVLTEALALQRASMVPPPYVPSTMVDKRVRQPTNPEVHLAEAHENTRENINARCVGMPFTPALPCLAFHFTSLHFMFTALTLFLFLFSPSQSINQTRTHTRRALEIINRIHAKLTGRDFAKSEDCDDMTVEQQVDRLIREATSVENLCQLYEGWAAWS